MVCHPERDRAKILQCCENMRFALIVLNPKPNDQMCVLSTWQLHIMRAVCKVRGLTLLLRVRNLWMCGDGLFFEVTPLESDALLTTLHPLLENLLAVLN
jgi:hypothetical protein